MIVERDREAHLPTCICSHCQARGRTALEKLNIVRTLLQDHSFVSAAAILDQIEIVLADDDDDNQPGGTPQ